MPCALWAHLYHTELRDVFSRHLKFDISSNEYQACIIATLATLTAWRYTQGVYCFNEDLIEKIAADACGSVISPQHVQRMHEWSVCINTQQLKHEALHCSHFYVHQNEINTPDGCKPCLILLFCQEHQSADPQFMPFVVLDAQSMQDIESAIITHGFFPGDDQDRGRVANLLKPYISLFNAIFDPGTEIESDIVGIKQPHHSNIQIHVNYNQLNIPNFKYAAPSNVRIWHCGANYMHQINTQKRKNGQTIWPYWNREQDEIRINLG